MKQEIIELPKNPEHRAAAIKIANAKMNALDNDNDYEFVLRNQTVGKTLRQLRGHFGVILKSVSDETGEDVDYIHRKMKAKFLAKIYVTNPIGPMQDQWVELLDIYQRTNAMMFIKHSKRISLEWVEKQQMRQYIDEVIAYYQNNGIAVNIPDPEKRRVA